MWYYTGTVTMKERTMKAATQEIINRNLARVTAEGGKLASMWDGLDAKEQRRWVSLWTRMERDEQADRQQNMRDEAADTAWTQLRW
jgi:hypothetical protein